jgi:hypothetical protein
VQGEFKQANAAVLRSHSATKSKLIDLSDEDAGATETKVVESKTPAFAPTGAVAAAGPVAARDTIDASSAAVGSLAHPAPVAVRPTKHNGLLNLGGWEDEHLRYVIPALRSKEDFEKCLLDNKIQPDGAAAFRDFLNGVQAEYKKVTSEALIRCLQPMPTQWKFSPELAIDTECKRLDSLQQMVIEAHNEQAFQQMCSVINVSTAAVEDGDGDTEMKQLGADLSRIMQPCACTMDAMLNSSLEFWDGAAGAVAGAQPEGPRSSCPLRAIHKYVARQKLEFRRTIEAGSKLLPVGGAAIPLPRFCIVEEYPHLDSKGHWKNWQLMSMMAGPNEPHAYAERTVSCMDAVHVTQWGTVNEKFVRDFALRQDGTINPEIAVARLPNGSISHQFAATAEERAKQSWFARLVSPKSLLAAPWEFLLENGHEYDKLDIAAKRLRYSANLGDLKQPRTQPLLSLCENGTRSMWIEHPTQREWLEYDVRVTQPMA